MLHPTEAELGGWRREDGTFATAELQTPWEATSRCKLKQRLTQGHCPATPKDKIVASKPIIWEPDIRLKKGVGCFVLNQLPQLLFFHEK